MHSSLCFYDLENLIQLISKIKYPSSTSLQLILVPYYNCEEDCGCKRFQYYKDKILEKTEEEQYKIFNNMKNNTGIHGNIITDVLLMFSDNKISLQDYSEKNISREEFIKLKTNFENTAIRIIRPEELIKIPISQDFLKRVITLNE